MNVYYTLNGNFGTIDILLVLANLELAWHSQSISFKWIL